MGCLLGVGEPDGDSGDRSVGGRKWERKDQTIAGSANTATYLIFRMSKARVHKNGGKSPGTKRMRNAYAFVVTEG